MLDAFRLVFLERRAMTLRTRLARSLVLSSLFLGFASAEWVDPAVLDACPGYSATNISTSGTKLTAGLVLAGTACNVFGNDSQTLSLEVTYETSSLFRFTSFVE